MTLRWRDRVWHCAERSCSVNTWTDQKPKFVLPRHSLTERFGVGRWATDRVAAIEATKASFARQLGVPWPTVWAAAVCHGQACVATLGRSSSGQVGFDESVISPAKQLRRRRLVTAAVDVVDGRIIDLLEGRNAVDLQVWRGAQPVDWVRQIEWWLSIRTRARDARKDGVRVLNCGGAARLVSHVFDLRYEKQHSGITSKLDDLCGPFRHSIGGPGPGPRALREHQRRRGRRLVQRLPRARSLRTPGRRGRKPSASGRCRARSRLRPRAARPTPVGRMPRTFSTRYAVVVGQRPRAQRTTVDCLSGRSVLRLRTCALVSGHQKPPTDGKQIRRRDELSTW